MHINILVKYMTAKCLQNQPDILWYKNGTDKMNGRHQREKKMYTWIDDEITHQVMISSYFTWTWIVMIGKSFQFVSKNVTCRYIVLQKINYHIGKKKITQQNFRSNIQRHCQHSYILRYFFLLTWHNFPHQINCSR